MLRHLQALTLAVTTLLATHPHPTDTHTPWCGQTRITGYVRTDFTGHTFDGTSIYTSERIVAASWDVVMGAIADIAGLGTFRVADRGSGLGYGTPMPWLDVAVWTREEALQLTGTRHVCFRRGTA